jgi:16S rRNA (guanine966-N2)-methyltransferase
MVGGSIGGKCVVSIRIIAGERRGHRLEGTAKRGLRPTSDLVRESIFNILGELVVGRPAIDLFAGTGALGLEALSRGASQAIFVDDNRSSLELIRKNVEHLRYAACSRVIAADAYRWMRKGDRAALGPVVVLIDPPYEDFTRRTRVVGESLQVLLGSLATGSVVVLQMPARLELKREALGVEWDMRRYGNTQVAIGEVVEHAARSGDDAPAASASSEIHP